jgi:excisionase family DNA binding protein
MSSGASTFGGALYVSVRQAAASLGKSERTVRYLCESGTVPAARIGRAWSVPVSWLRQLAPTNHRQ